MSEHPELDKLLAVAAGDRAKELTRFVDWLNDNGMTICRSDDEADDEFDKNWIPVAAISYERLFARYFGIDLDKANRERAATLDRLRRRP